MKTVLALLAALALPQLVGGLGALATSSSLGSWYGGLEKPWFTPPSGVFGPVWITLYAMMGVASWLVWREGGFADDRVRAALVLYGIHLVFNLAWSLLFFGLQSPLLGLLEILLLVGLVAFTAIRFWEVSTVAGALMVPYLLWTIFATALNAGIWWLNR